MPHSNLSRALGRLQRRSDVVAPNGRPYHPHAFRHFAASWLIDQGFQPKRVQTILGHSSIVMTLDVYGHLFPADDDQERLAAGELRIIGSVAA